MVLPWWTSVVAALAALATAGPTSDSTSTVGGYTIYAPKVELSTVVDAFSATEPLKYNHDSSIAHFHGVWIVVWNGNRLPKEGVRPC
jgi:hypothetical protein